MAKVKILFLASNPLEQSRLALDEEIRAITAQIRSADHRDAIELISAWAVRPDDIQLLLLQHKPHVVHFSGHGMGSTPTGATAPNTATTRRDMTVSQIVRVEDLMLVGEHREAQPMSKEALVHVFSVLTDNVHLVLLSACHSEPIAQALAEVIPCTIGMSGAITDDAAMAFATVFYRGLGFGRNIQEAFELGKSALMSLQAPEHQAPRLHSRNGAVNPAKVVLVGLSIAASQRPTAGADRNRVAMLEKIRAIWITGFLQKSLFYETRVLLGLSEKPDAVARPMDLLARRPDEKERSLPSGTRIVDVYDSMDQSLLILGAPGSGKTTLLLELARDLLTRAIHDPEHPIPVIFPLSAWDEFDSFFGSFRISSNFGGWLARELCLRYDVPRLIAAEWVETDQVLPLLDGLDEVKAELSDACVEAINEFRHTHGLRPLVITSRTADYQALAEPLRLHGAILVRPLTHEQVNEYLTDLGPAGEPVRAAIREDPTLWELLDSPLLLNIVTVCYASLKAVPVPIHGTVVERRDQLFGAYVNEMLRRRAADSRYSRDQTEQWLGWLARQMADRGQTVFYLERLQIDWFAQKQRWAIQVSTVLVSTLICGLVGGLEGGLVAGPIFGLAAGLQRGLLVGLVGGLELGLVIGLVAGLILLSNEIVCVETVRWSWSHCWRSRASITVVGLVVGLVAGIIGRMVIGLQGGLVMGLSLGLIAGLIAGLLAGLTFGEIERTAVPNEGIHRSARNAIFFGPFVGLAFGLLVGLVIGLFYGLVFGLFGGLVEGRVVVGLSSGLIFGLIFGLFWGLVGGLHAGGEACLKHFVLRGWLVRNGSTPWNYVRFLEYAAERILLRKLGGGYVFLHRMLLEYFAALYVEPGIKTTVTAKSAELSGDL